jgi:hypothetical protein
VGAEHTRGRGRCQERAARAGAAPAGRPGRLAPRFVSLRASPPVLAPARGPPSAARGPSPPSARSLSLLRVVTKHYKKAVRAVPGIGGRGPGAAYIPARAASAAAPTRTPRATATATATAATPGSVRRQLGPAPAAAPHLVSIQSTPGARLSRPGDDEARGTRARQPLCGLHGRQHLGAAWATAGRRAATSPWGP